jgi:hypothetical protein
MSNNNRAAPVDEASAEVRAWMSKLGKARTPAKLASVKQAQVLGAAARRKDPLTLICTCSGGDSLEASAHVWTCPRGRLLKQREQAAKRRAVAQAENEAAST